MALTCRERRCSGRASPTSLAPDSGPVSLAGRPKIDRFPSRAAFPAWEPQPRQRHDHMPAPSGNLGPGSGAPIFCGRRLDPRRKKASTSPPHGPLARQGFSASHMQRKWRDGRRAWDRVPSFLMTVCAGSVKLDRALSSCYLRLSLYRPNARVARDRFFLCPPVLRELFFCLSRQDISSSGSSFFSRHVGLLREDSLPQLSFASGSRATSSLSRRTGILTADRDSQRRDGTCSVTLSADFLKPFRNAAAGSLPVLQRKAHSLFRQMRGSAVLAAPHSQSVPPSETAASRRRYMNCGALEASQVLGDAGPPDGERNQVLLSYLNKQQVLRSFGQMETAGSAMLVPARSLSRAFYQHQGRRWVVRIVQPLIHHAKPIAAGPLLHQGNGQPEAVRGRLDPESAGQRSEVGAERRKSCRAISTRVAHAERDDEVASRSQTQTRWNHGTGAFAPNETPEKQMMAAAWRRVERAVRAVEALQPNTASAAEIADVASLCQEAAEIAATSTVDAEPAGTRKKGAKIRVPLRIKITLISTISERPHNESPYARFCAAWAEVVDLVFGERALLWLKIFPVLRVRPRCCLACSFGLRNCQSRYPGPPAEPRLSRDDTQSSVWGGPHPGGAGTRQAHEESIL